MTFARAAALPKGVSRAVVRRAGATSRNQSWRQVGRRGYASGHGQQQSSEIPWIIGSAALTIPAAGWLLQQGPKKSEHGHDAHHKKHEEEATEDKEEEQPQEEEDSQEVDKDESKEEDKEDSKEDSKEEGKEEEKEEEKEDSSEGESKDSSEEGSTSEDSGKSEDGYELPSPNAPKQINWDSSKSKGPGEGQKGERAATEKKGEKDAQGDKSGAKHPYLDDPEKSKKGLGVTETAKIHGTVDPSAGARGVKDSGSSSKDD